ncbi:MAG: cytochrome c-type biogenesis protein CcmH [Candidatus Marinimicrobia bacterium]|nr:cytochrome c-type biogenesis protein CcmH [Candidatus Neomarinimicrobiota bacterium]MCF7840741.1 cytochrome c-type biogenesis protein CcmH [Candidatus Neomarinimicrobiota bacterium]MCF7902365.1 cytochrome c-type biogenesis protein CcmH [Candidatus Neomarinimicrobiota bacterium]
MKAITFTLSLLLTIALFGDQVTELDDQLTDAQKSRVVQMEKEIMAACCFGSPVHSHGRNDYTEEQRVEIRRLIMAGKTNSEILDHFRNKIDPRTGQPYGNRILAAPKSDELVGQVSYWMVAVFAVLGIFVLWFALQKLLGRRQMAGDSTPGEKTGKVNDKILQKVEKELKDLDKD